MACKCLLLVFFQEIPHFYLGVVAATCDFFFGKLYYAVYFLGVKLLTVVVNLELLQIEIVHFLYILFYIFGCWLFDFLFFCIICRLCTDVIVFFFVFYNIRLFLLIRLLLILLLLENCLGLLLLLLLLVFHVLL